MAFEETYDSLIDDTFALVTILSRTCENVCAKAFIGGLVPYIDGIFVLAAVGEEGEFATLLGLYSEDCLGVLDTGRDSVK